MKYHIRRFCICITLMLPTLLIASDLPDLKTQEQRYSYTLGYQIGSQIFSQMRNTDLEIDIDSFVQAINDVLSDRTPFMTIEEMTEALEIHELGQNKKQNAIAESGRIRGEDYQDDYKEKSGVVETSSGLLYRVIKTGDGKTPSQEDTVVVHYVGQLIDGTKFDSSRDRGAPAIFRLSGIIPGWQEVLQLMREGDTWEVVIPSDLAYGAQGAGTNIGPNETLIFEIELISVK